MTHYIVLLNSHFISSKQKIINFFRFNFVPSINQLNIKFNSSLIIDDMFFNEKLTKLLTWSWQTLVFFVLFLFFPFVISLILKSIWSIWLFCWCNKRYEKTDSLGTHQFNHSFGQLIVVSFHYISFHFISFEHFW